MRLHTIVNGRAGSVINLDREALAARLRQTLGETGHDVEVEIVEPEELIPAITRAAATQVDAIVVGGGDGTIRAAAGILKDGPLALGILPLGTLNRLARDLNIPIDLDAAASALAHASIRSIDMAELNGQPFLCNSLIGLPPIYSRQRQRQRGQPFLQRIRAYTRAIRQILRSRRKLTITFDNGRERSRTRILSLAVSNNRYADNAGMIPKRPDLDHGELGVYIARHESGWALALAFARAMLGRWRSDPKLTATVARNIEIRTSKSQIRVSNDGEVELVETPLRYRSLPRALKVLAPVPPAVMA